MIKIIILSMCTLSGMACQTKKAIQKPIAETEQLTTPLQKELVTKVHLPTKESIEKPLDTLLTTFDTGDSLFTYIYEYHDTLPEKPVKRFVTKNQNDSVILKSYDRSLTLTGTIVDDDYSFVLYPAYYINESDQNIIISNNLYLASDEGLIISSALEDSFFESIVSDQNQIFHLGKTKLSQKKLVDIKNIFPTCNLNASEIEELVRRFDGFNESDDLYLINFIMSQQASQEFMELFFCSISNNSMKQKVNNIFVTDLNLPNEEEYRFELFYLACFIYNILK